MDKTNERISYLRKVVDKVGVRIFYLRKMGKRLMQGTWEPFVLLQWPIKGHYQVNEKQVPRGIGSLTMTNLGSLQGKW